MVKGKAVIKIEIDYDYTQVHMGKKDMKQILEACAKRAAEAVKQHNLSIFARVEVKKAELKIK